MATGGKRGKYLYSVELKNSHIVHLSGRINLWELQHLATIGFSLEKTVIDNALDNNKHDIQGAVREVLHMGLNKQSAGKNRYVCLQEALRKCQMNLLVAYLQKLVEGTEDEKTKENSLQDEHVLELSMRIQDRNELMEFGIKVLMFKADTIKAAMYDHSDSIQAATHELLSKWLKQQPSRQEAYMNLLEGLKRAQMNQLASNLRIWVEGSGVIPQMMNERIADFQCRVKYSLERNFKDCLKHDWLEDGKTIPLMQYYTDLLWTRMVKGAKGRQYKSMKGIDELLKIPGASIKCIKILVEARGGMGKTSSMAMLAMKWVNDENKEFPFDFVFLIPMIYVDENCSLSKLVADEHDLEKEDIPLLQDLLKGTTKYKVLLLLDGYDEYTPGTNTELDRAIEKTLGKCLIILTTRPQDDTDFTRSIRKKMDCEVVIEGFSEESIKKCCSQFLGSEREAEIFLQDANRAGVYELLKVPTILLMMSVLYNEDDKKSLPERKTQLYEDLYEFMMDRSTLKSHNYGSYSSQIPNLQDMLQTLGKFAWEALQRGVRQLYIEKAALEKECPDIMKLGLLHLVGVRKATARKQPTFLAFEHESFQQFAASKFVTKRLETAEKMKETLKELFPSWQAVQRYREVVLFVAGLMKDSRPLVQYVYKIQTEEPLLPIDDDLLNSLHAESFVRLVDDPLHNKYINYYNHDEDERPSDTAPVYYPSRLYEFYHMRHEVVLENHLTQGEIAPCAMWIYEPRKAVMDSLLSICSDIFTHQAVTDLYMKGVTCNWLETPRLIKPQMLYLNECLLPDIYVKQLFLQLFGCGETLQCLQLFNMNLGPYESLLDELLEDLVAHHEAGLAQRELRLLIGYSNLFEEFVKKWRNRCGKVDSIDYMTDSANLITKGPRESFRAFRDAHRYEATTTEGSGKKLGGQEKGSEKMLISQEKDTCEQIMKKKTSNEVSDNTKGKATGVSDLKPGPDVKYLTTLSSAVLRSKGQNVKYSDLSAKGKQVVSEEETEGTQIYPMIFYKNHKQYHATMTNGKPLTVKSPDSEISLEVPKGLKAVIMQHIHTDYEEINISIPSLECIVSPAVRFIVHNGNYQDSEHLAFKAKIPHCLPEGYDFSFLKVRLGNLSRKGSLKEVQRGKPQSTATPYYIADKKYITLYTSHFCDMVCTSTKKTCDSLAILPFGYLYPLTDENQTRAKVNVFLCSYLYNNQDIRKELVNSQACFGLDLLQGSNLSIEVEDFDPLNSKVTLSVKSTVGGGWKTVTGTRSTQKLTTLFHIENRHFCRTKTMREAATFDLMNEKPKTSLAAVFDVILHAARIPKPNESEAAKLTEDVDKAFEIHIPPLKAQGTSQMGRSNVHEDSKRELNAAKMLKLSKRINSPLELNCLAVFGLDMDVKVVDKHIKNNDEFNMAVFGVLKEWFNSIESPEDAYRMLYEALGMDDVDMKSHRQFLE